MLTCASVAARDCHPVRKVISSVLYDFAAWNLLRDWNLHFCGGYSPFQKTRGSLKISSVLMGVGQCHLDPGGSLFPFCSICLTGELGIPCETSSTCMDQFLICFLNRRTLKPGQRLWHMTCHILFVYSYLKQIYHALPQYKIFRFCCEF